MVSFTVIFLSWKIFIYHHVKIRTLLVTSKSGFFGHGLNWALFFLFLSHNKRPIRGAFAPRTSRARRTRSVDALPDHTSGQYKGANETATHSPIAKGTHQEKGFPGYKQTSKQAIGAPKKGSYKTKRCRKIAPTPSSFKVESVLGGQKTTFGNALAILELTKK